jgi:hypothetical protein
MALFGSGRRPDSEHVQPLMEDYTPPAPPIRPALPAPYGIAEVVRLMRGLPVEQNVELVVRVIKSTLETLSIRVSDIIDDASNKQKAIQERVAMLEGEIGELSRQIETRRHEIGRLQAELKETTTAKERLQLAEMAGTSSVPPPEVAYILPKTNTED